MATTKERAGSESHPVKRILPLLDEYTKKLQAGANELQQLNMEYLTEKLAFAEWNYTPLHGVASNLIQLKREITEKKLELMREAHRSKYFAFTTFVPAAQKFAQYVSQTIEHSLTDPLDAVVLSLRLAELESAIQYAHSGTHVLID